MKIKRIETNFTQVSNNILKDNRLTWKAKGVFAYLYSKPDDWDFSTERMKFDSFDGREALLSGLKELEILGYLQRKRFSSGKMEYVLDYNPKSEKPIEAKKPLSENPTEVKSHSGKTRRISNTELNTSNTEEESKTEGTRVGSIKFLDSIPESDLEEWTQRFIATKKELRSKAEDVRLYCERKKKVYKNYRSLLLGAIKKDFKERDNETVAGGKYKGL